jgi:predicted transcriptional regulator
MKHGRFGGLWSDKRNRVFKLHEQGLSVPRIADELRVSPSAVRSALKAVEVQQILKTARMTAQDAAR